MTSPLQDAYKQQVLNDFNNRPNYDNEFHKRAATRLVELANLQLGHAVLDIATGTGLAAIAAAELVGPTGQVLGTDFAAGMLQQAQQKVETLGLTNLRFEEADADHQVLPEGQFDAVLCSAAIVYLTDIPASLRRWHDALKPGGVIAFSCLAETSPTAFALFRRVVQKYGLAISNPNELLGTPERCHQILTSLEFQDINVTSEQFGFYLPDFEAVWTASAQSAIELQTAKWSDQRMAQCQQEYQMELSQSATEAGFWNDITLFFVTARKYSRSSIR